MVAAQARIMPPPSTPCPTCGKMFFAHSLAMHTAQCAPKMAKQMVGCPACGMACQQGNLNDHLSQCKAAREIMGVAPPPRRARTPSPSARGEKVKAATARAGSPRGGPASSPRAQKPPAAAPIQLISEPLPDGRVPCARCGRAFAPDRIAKHQFVCAQLAMGPPKKPKEVAGNERFAGVVEAAVENAGMRPLKRMASSARARSGSAGRRGAPEPRKPASKWRAASEELQHAMRAAREGAKLDVLKEKGLVYQNGKPKKGVTQEMMRAATSPSKRTSGASVSVGARGADGSPYAPSAVDPRHAAMMAAQEHKRAERLAELDEIRDLLSDGENDATSHQASSAALHRPAPLRCPKEFSRYLTISHDLPRSPARDRRGVRFKATGDHGEYRHSGLPTAAAGC